MKLACSAIALLATAIAASAAVATEPTTAAPGAVVSVCKRHMIGLGPNYEPKFRMCAYLAGAVEDVHMPANGQQDAQDFAAIQSYTKTQYIN